MKILIVDDEEMIRAVLREYIEFEGGEADEACDGMEAVKMCRENNYDVILMDVMMPRLDGFSAVKEIRKFKQTPVIMLSARGEEYDKAMFQYSLKNLITLPGSYYLTVNVEEIRRETVCSESWSRKPRCLHRSASGSERLLSG